MSFIRKATFPTMAGNPAAEGAQPPAMNGMIVTVQRNVTNRSKSAQDSKLLIPEAGQQQRSKQPLEKSE